MSVCFDIISTLWYYFKPSEGNEKLIKEILFIYEKAKYKWLP